MKRIFLAATASSILALAAPGVALAHHGKHHNRGHHVDGRTRHARRAHTVSFTPATVPGAPGSAPAAPTGTDEQVATVTTFKNGVLTITLTDGSIVSGKVTEETEIKCHPATPPSSVGDDEGQGDDESPGSDEAQHSSGSDGQSPPQSPGPVDVRQHGDWMDDNGGGDGSNDGDDSQEGCTEAALVEKAPIRAAELNVSSAGAVWEKIDLIK